MSPCPSPRPSPERRLARLRPVLEAACMSFSRWGLGWPTERVHVSVLTYRYGLFGERQMSVAQAARVLNLHRLQVRHLECEALERLRRNPYLAQLLEERP